MPRKTRPKRSQQRRRHIPKLAHLKRRARGKRFLQKSDDKWLLGIDQ
jgi:hypothetical protein